MNHEHRALLLIDHILSNIGDEDPLLSRLYTIAHSAHGECPNPHEDWVKETEDTYKAMCELNGKEEK